MKVICDNCRAVYKIPDEKLVKPVNKATCRQCGHRMLIPRPRKDADPDEKTLVTAVPPTPPPAPTREQLGPVTAPMMEEEAEKTLPGKRVETEWVKNDLVSLATPLPASQRPTTPYEEASPRPMAPPTPRPASARASSPAPRSRGARAEEAEPTPVPASFGESPSTGSRHDPSSDLTWALLGGIGALVGALILALGALLQGPLNIAAPFDSLIVFSGLAIATGGAFATVLVVLTGKRGRRKARPMLSIIAATALALFVALVPVGVRLGVDYAQGSSYWAPVYAMLEPGPAIAPGTPALPLTTPTDPLETTAAVADADDGTDQTESDEPTGDDLEPPVEDVTSAPAADASSGTADPEPVTVRATPPPVRTAPAPVRTTPPRTTTPPATTRPTRVAPAPVVSKPPPRDEPIDMEDELDLPDDVLADTPPKRPTSSSSGSSLPERPPTTAIDLIMRNNVEIKKCFFYYQKEHGELPKQVDVRFSISPGGASSAITVVQSKYAATDLERCLQGAIKGITFPPSQLGEKLTFPFRL